MLFAIVGRPCQLTVTVLYYIDLVVTKCYIVNWVLGFMKKEAWGVQAHLFRTINMLDGTTRLYVVRYSH